ncbi:MAG: TonB-dependent receptor [Caulobacteraceae bacterium]|nr:TonB-dependent receptor [Caulobacteraceae bacterium]
MSRLHVLIASTAIVAGGFGAATAAQAAATGASAPEQVTEVIVTAQKREQRVQDVPLAITAFNAQTLQAASATNLTDLDGKIPNVTLEAVATFPNASSFSIRGLAFGDVESTFEPTVGVEANGVYLARNVGATQDFFDISSIEVRRGPQGTLDGGNTIGGVVAINTKKPTGGFDGELQLTAGDHRRAEVRLAVDAPIVKDVLSARLSILDLNYGGYLQNTYNNTRMGQINSLSERLTLAYTPSGPFDATLVLDHTTDRDGGFPYINGTPAVGSIAPAPDFVLAELGFPTDPHQKPYDVNSSTPLHYDFSTTGVSAQLNWRLGFGTVTSVTGYREYDDDNNNEYGGAGFPYFTSARTQNHDQFSEEVRLASPGGGRLDYVVGVYYLHQHYDLQNAEGGTLFGGYTLVQYANQDDNSYAAFGQFDYHLTSQLTLTAGGRYSYEDKSFHNQPPGYSTDFGYKDNWSDFSPKFVASYKFTPDIMAYAQYARGYRSGGFNGRAGSETSAGPYNAEHVDSYEIGLKNQFFDRRWVLNADVFYSKYDNIQEEVQRLSAITGDDETVVENAGAATYAGVEVESHAILGHGFSIDNSIGYLDAHFDSFTANLNGDCAVGVTSYFCGVNDYKNIPLPSAPHWTISMTGNYRHELPFAVFAANLSATYTSSQYTSLSPINTVAPFSLRKANTIVNTTISLATLDEKYRVSLWIKNLTDQHVLYGRFAVGPLSAPESFEPPLTWGVSLAGKF